MRENCAVTADPSAGHGRPSLEVRPARQRRSQESWTRVLDAGIALLEESGYEGFTIAAVCDRAGVPPRALYARIDTKDALFLAVYDHGLARVRADHAVFEDEERWRDVPAHRVAVEAVNEVAGIFRRHAALLRAVVLISGAHPEVYRRGSRHGEELGDLFTQVMLRAGAGSRLAAPETAVRGAFGAVFASLVVHTAYGPAFAAAQADDEQFLATLSAMVESYLFPS